MGTLGTTLFVPPILKNGRAAAVQPFRFFVLFYFFSVSW